MGNSCSSSSSLSVLQCPSFSHLPLLPCVSSSTGNHKVQFYHLSSTTILPAVSSWCACVMQVVQRMKEQLPISNPVRLLHHTCQQVQAQAQTGSGGYSSMSEGYSQGPQEVFVSRGMASAPEDSFVRASSSMPPPPFADAQMFRGALLHCPVVTLPFIPDCNL